MPSVESTNLYSVLVLCMPGGNAAENMSSQQEIELAEQVSWACDDMMECKPVHESKSSQVTHCRYLWQLFSWTQVLQIWVSHSSESLQIMLVSMACSWHISSGLVLPIHSNSGSLMHIRFLLLPPLLDLPSHSPVLFLHALSSFLGAYY